jgi:hypothetical protein
VGRGLRHLLRLIVYPLISTFLPEVSCVLRAYRCRPSVIHMLDSTCTLARRIALLFPHRPQSYYLLNSSIPPLMSSSPSSSNFQIIFDNALRAYQTRIKKDLLTHPLAAQLEDCRSPGSILDVLQQQVEELNRSQRRNERWTRWLDPTVKVLHAFSGMLGEHVTLVCLRLSTCIRPTLS